jgi:hypothetical protein
MYYGTIHRYGAPNQYPNRVREKAITNDKIAPSLLLPQTVRTLRDISAPELARAAVGNLYLHLQVSKQIASANSWAQDYDKDRFIETFWAGAEGFLAARSSDMLYCEKNCIL